MHSTEFRSMPLRTLLELHNSKGLVLFEGQRGKVWNVGQRKRLITSILIGDGMPEILLRFTSDKEPFQLLDGQQRITTLFNYIKGEGEPSKSDSKDEHIPEEVLSIYPAEYRGKLFKELPKEAQDIILNYDVRLEIKRLYSKERAAFTYQLRNSGSSMKSSDKRRAYYNSPINVYVYGDKDDVTSKNTLDAKFGGIFSDKQALSRCVISVIVSMGLVAVKDDKDFTEIGYPALDKVHNDLAVKAVALNDSVKQRTEHILKYIRNGLGDERNSIYGKGTSPLVFVSVFQSLLKYWEKLRGEDSEVVMHKISEAIANAEPAQLSTTTSGDSAGSNAKRLMVIADSIASYI